MRCLPNPPAPFPTAFAALTGKGEFTASALSPLSLEGRGAGGEGRARTSHNAESSPFPECRVAAWIGREREPLSVRWRVGTGAGGLGKSAYLACLAYLLILSLTGCGPDKPAPSAQANTDAPAGVETV